MRLQRFAFICLVLTFLSIPFYDASAQEVIVASGVKVTDPTNTGAARASIPVEIPPGRGGIAPNLVLRYNSNAPNSWLGVGWDLEMGVIQRSTKRGINYSGNEFIFEKDDSSAELVPRSEWGANYYGAKIEGAFSKFYFNPTTGGWVVTTKDGTKYFYGSTAASRQDSASGVFKWCLDEVRDSNGNQMTLTYWKDSGNGEIYLQRIDYTGNVKGLSPTNYVTFTLESRTDAPLMYTTNAPVRTAYRLKNISVYNKIGTTDTLVRKYMLNYSYSPTTYRSILTSITQYGSDGVSALPTLQFGWQAGRNSWTAMSGIGNFGTNQSFTNDTTHPILAGDFNGDGRTDVGRVTATGITIYLADGNGGWSGTFILSYFGAGSYSDGNKYPIVVGDFNGDGKADIGRVYDNGISFYLSDGTGGWTPMSSIGDFGPGQGYSDANKHPIFTGDFNDDGKIDAGRVYSDRVAVYLSTGTGWSGPYNLYDFGANSYPDGNYKYPMVIGDFNGDGKTDVGRVHSGGVAFYLSDGNGNWASINGINSDFSPGQGYSDANTYPLVIGDFNGDGRTDVGRVHGSGVRVYLSSGSGGWTMINDLADFSPAQGYGYNGVFPIFAGDFNGDGRTDIGRVHGNGVGFYLSNGGGWISPLAYINGDFSPSQNYSDGNAYPLYVGDFNGDGRMDMGRVHGSGVSFYRVSSYQSDPPADLVSGIKNGMGGTTTISYAPSSAYANELLPFIVQTVSSVSVNDGRGNISTTNYSYAYGFYHQGEREFRGFEYVKTKAPSGATTETWFKTDDTVLKGLPYSQVVKNAAGLISTRTLNNYLWNSVYTGAAFPYLDHKDDYICDGATSSEQDMALCKHVATDFEYDAYGNITREQFWGDVNVDGDGRDVHTSYEPYDTANWLVSLPKTTYTQSNGIMKAQTWFEYYPGTGNLHYKRFWLSGEINPSITYGYDNYGNQTSITDAKGYITIIGYDSSTLTYPAATTNHLGHVTTAAYDYRFGKPRTKTDANGNTTTYTYDVFGRLIKVINPGDEASAYGTVTYSYEDSGVVGDQRVTKISAEVSSSISSIICPAGGVYNSSAGRCEAPAITNYQCSTTGQTYSDSGVCNNTCNQTASCSYTTAKIAYTGASRNISGYAGFNMDITAIFLVTDDVGYIGCYFAQSWDTLLPHERTTIPQRYGFTNGQIVTYINGWYYGYNFCGGDYGAQYSLLIHNCSSGYQLINGYCDNGISPYQLYHCPLYSGSACSGSPSTCSAPQPCDPVISCPAGYDANNGVCVASPLVPENYIWNETYFDGLGRVIKTRAEGPDSKIITRDTVYNQKGQVDRTSVSYFEGRETARWTLFKHDDFGRILDITNPDNTVVSTRYNQGRTTFIDANNHVRVEEKDAQGRLVKVEEYTGVYPNQALYATTAYVYDVLSNLTNVIDAYGNETVITYDTLSRKRSMTDPDMGSWVYNYDPNGNLSYQKDARGKEITFTYDELNRIKLKHYVCTVCTGIKDVEYRYDETFSTNFKGRLTTVIDISGTEKYFYDPLGRVKRTIKNVDGKDYSTEAEYDPLGREKSIKYPDASIVSYRYNTGGFLSEVVGYAIYSGYNALGQPGTINYANGVSTDYGYELLTNRLSSIITKTAALVEIQNIAYKYDNVGNIVEITDPNDSTPYGTVTYDYDKIGNITYNSQIGTYAYALDGTRPHAVVQTGGNSYSYDANGNMISRLGRTFTYDHDNRPTSMVYSGGTVTFVYDYTGQRVKKASSIDPNIYIGRIYRCTDTAGANCYKYIFAGKDRIAFKTPANDTRFYHADHLGSSNIITKSDGTKSEEMYYYPYGATRVESGTTPVRHKFTGQEQDDETGLYYYGARYYDPHIGRFISPDVIVQDPSDPQVFNRYSYARNNPLLYTDPTGQFFGIDDLIIGAVIGGAIFGGANAAIQGGDFGDILSGAFIGGVTGGIAGGFGLAASSIVTAAGASAATATFVGGIAGGAIGGVISSAESGKIGQGLLIGAITGGVSGYLGTLNLGAGYLGDFVQLGTSTLIGGVTSELTGGTFSEGAYIGAMSAAVAIGLDKAFSSESQPHSETEYKRGDALTTISSGNGLVQMVSIAPISPGTKVNTLDFLIGGGVVGKAITFGHGARHFAGTGLSEAAVQSAIRAQIRAATRGATATGSFWGRVKVGGVTIEYRAYTLPSGRIHVGTHYPVPGK
ncbi:MAG: FG-GAP-like repeat-containing protein [Nitrospirota bacterium]